ncbi:MAG: phage tail sheath subtilisin-like domain-containing protein [Proteobacteria bacterium]|jgi:phage tail sheath protein FI|nr:phage tail sheath subtilisin-like domain-containing protein [Pseudomonadota bacterium]
MAANYLHGVETIEVERGPRPVKAVKSAVIALIGTAPSGPANKPTLWLSEKDSATWGPKLSGYTIPQALDIIAGYGAATVIVINVCDPAIHKSAVADEALRLGAVTDRGRLAFGSVSNLVIQSTDGATTYQAVTDYTADLASGILTRVPDGNIPAGATLNASYDHTDPSLVTASDILGTVNAAGQRTGMKALKDTYNQFGFFAKILIAPAFGSLTSVSTALIGLADELGGVSYIDAPIGTSFAQALAGRGPNGTINFNTSSERVRLCYPHMVGYDPASNTERLVPLSIHAAALRAKVDLDKGFWLSSSNQELVGVIGVERQLSAMIDDPQSEVNLLNEQGITTVFSSYGTGYRLWGNRTAAWPTITHMKNFENVRRTGDMINESLRYFSLQFVDMPLDQALIDALLESVNAYGRKLIGDGALLGFKAWFDPERNEETELAAGHLLISYKYNPPTPMERLTYETEITSEYLLTLKGNN